MVSRTLKQTFSPRVKWHVATEMCEMCGNSVRQTASEDKGILAADNRVALCKHWRQDYRTQALSKAGIYGSR